MNAKRDQPLTESTYLVLISLAPGPLHGYAILKRSEKISDGAVILGTGTLFGILRRLLEAGWIERRDPTCPATDNRGQKHYALTRAGRRALSAEQSRLEQLARFDGIHDRQPGVRRTT